MSDPQDRILEVFLEQMLDEHARPDLSDKILRKHDRRETASKRKTTDKSDLDETLSPTLIPVELPETLPTETLPPETHLSRPIVRPQHTRPQRSHQTTISVWIARGSVAAVALVAVGVTLWLLSGGGDPQPDPTVAKQNGDDPLFEPIPEFAANQPPIRKQPNSGTVTDRVKIGNETIQPNRPPQVARRDDIPEDQMKLVFPGKFVRQALPPIDGLSSLEAAEMIDGRLGELWQRDGLQPAQLADDRAWINRLSNRMIGRTPSADEIQQINGLLATLVDSPQKRERLVDLFVNSEQFQGEFNDHWARLIAWRLLGLSTAIQSEMIEDPDMIRVKDLVKRRIAAGDGLDEMGYELISAVGSTDPQRDDFNPASSFMIGLIKRFGKRELVSSHISQAFLGMQTRCAQCHDSATDERIAQSKFWEFHAFFAQMRVEAAGVDHFLVVNRNFLPMGTEGKSEAPLVYEDPAGQAHQAYPRLDSQALDPNGFVAKVDRRTTLANLVANSPQWREALVDHVWTSLLNMPVTGVHDERLDPAVEPLLQLRSQLGQQLAANGWQLKWLIKSIALSEAFALGAGTDVQIDADNPYVGGVPRFSRFYHRYSSNRSPLSTLKIVATAYSSGDAGAALSAGLLARVDGTRSDDRNAASESIRPYLPSQENQWATSSAITQQLERIAASKLSQSEKIEHLVLTALGRPPRDAEIQQAELILKNAKNERMAMQDIWWSLVNSVEYDLPLNVR